MGNMGMEMLCLNDIKSFHGEIQAHQMILLCILCPMF